MHWNAVLVQGQWREKPNSIIYHSRFNLCKQSSEIECVVESVGCNDSESENVLGNGSVWEVNENVNELLFVCIFCVLEAVGKDFVLEVLVE